MAHIKISKGLNIPIEGGVESLQISSLWADGRSVQPQKIALNVEDFDEMRFRLLKKEGQKVLLGEPLLEDKGCPSRFFVAPASGEIVEVRRGLKRRLLDVVIAVDNQEAKFNHGVPKQGSPSELIDLLKRGGAFTKIRQRPFDLLANPDKIPRDIFVKAVESAPLAPPFELQVQGFEKEFQAGLDVLSKLTEGKVHLVFHKDTTCHAFKEAKNVEKHTVEGPHPIGTHSLHIHQISPIQKIDEVVWTVNAHDVVSIGHLVLTGEVFVERVISIAGPSILKDKRGFFKVREGYPIELLIASRLPEGEHRLISGDPLMGDKVTPLDYLGFSHFTFCAIPEAKEREFLHFFRLGTDKYTASKTYLSGFLHNMAKKYLFNTSLHGEERPFVIGLPYEKVMPMRIPVMSLVKAVIVEDWELAERLGFLEIAPEDFALSTFVCPSKVEMCDIIHQAIAKYAKEVI